MAVFFSFKWNTCIRIYWYLNYTKCSLYLTFGGLCCMFWGPLLCDRPHHPPVCYIPDLEPQWLCSPSGLWKFLMLHLLLFCCCRKQNCLPASLHLFFGWLFLLSNISICWYYMINLKIFSAIISAINFGGLNRIKFKSQVLKMQ